MHLSVIVPRKIFFAAGNFEVVESYKSTERKNAEPDEHNKRERKIEA